MKHGEEFAYELSYLINPETCEKCREVNRMGGWNHIDLLIYHGNDHVWPGFAGEPNGEDYGGSDF